MKCNLEEGARSPQNRRLPHGFADFLQFCPLLTASWFAVQLPVWGAKGGDSCLHVRRRTSRLIGCLCHMKQKQEVRRCVSQIRTLRKFEFNNMRDKTRILILKSENSL